MRSRPGVIVTVLVLAAGAVAAALALGASSGADATGFERGDMSEWQLEASVDPGRQLRVVQSPVRSGRFAVRVSVDPGDSFAGTAGERSLFCKYESVAVPGDDYYYSWSLLFPPGWRAPSRWGIVAEWHNPHPMSPEPWVAPIAFDTRGSNTLSLRLFTGLVDARGAASFQRRYPLPGLDRYALGRWIDFVVHIRFSAYAGAIDVWTRRAGERDYVRALHRAGIPTTIRTAAHEVVPLYFCGGFYRNASSFTSVLYEDGFDRQPAPRTCSTPWRGCAPPPAPGESP